MFACSPPEFALAGKLRSTAVAAPAGAARQLTATGTRGRGRQVPGEVRETTSVLVWRELWRAHGDAKKRAFDKPTRRSQEYFINM